MLCPPRGASWARIRGSASTTNPAEIACGDNYWTVWDSVEGAVEHDLPHVCPGILLPKAAGKLPERLLVPQHVAAEPAESKCAFSKPPMASFALDVHWHDTQSASLPGAHIARLSDKFTSPVCPALTLYALGGCPAAAEER